MQCVAVLFKVKYTINKLTTTNFIGVLTQLRINCFIDFFQIQIYIKNMFNFSQRIINFSFERIK